MFLVFVSKLVEFVTKGTNQWILRKCSHCALKCEISHGWQHFKIAKGGRFEGSQYIESWRATRMSCKWIARGVRTRCDRTGYDSSICQSLFVISYSPLYLPSQSHPSFSNPLHCFHSLYWSRFRVHCLHYNYNNSWEFHQLITESPNFRIDEIYKSRF